MKDFMIKCFWILLLITLIYGMETLPVFWMRSISMLCAILAGIFLTSVLINKE